MRYSTIVEKNDKTLLEIIDMLEQFEKDKFIAGLQMRHYFGALAEKYFDDKTRDAAANVQRRGRTIEAFNRLPEEFTVDDVMRCFTLKSNTSARTRVVRLLKDRLAEKVEEFVENGTTKAKYRKTGSIML